jgi:hypothetical protein
VEKIDWAVIVEKLIRWQWTVTAMLVAIGMGIWAVFRKYLPAQLPLFYSRPWGEEQLVSTPGLWWPLLIGVIVAVFATIAARSLNSEKVLAAILVTAGIISQVILLLAVLRIVLIVT